MKAQTKILAVTALVGFALGMARGAERYDHTVRQDVFAGLNGDRSALDRASAKIAATLADEPNHAEALVWRGGIRFFQSGQAFQAQDRQRGVELYTQAMIDFEKAVQLAPDNLGVRIPRAAVLMTAANLSAGNPMAKDWARMAISDYEHVRAIQEPRFATLGTHPRGELLQGLANGYRLLGDEAKATQYFARLQKELTGTEYAKRAALWLETKTLAPSQTSCIGCHTGR